jgi:hypothetical protein
MKKTLAKTLAVVLIGAFLTLSVSSCYGKFELTRKVYTWNGSLGDKWINSIVMWVFIYTVYPIVGTVDFLVLNTLEFWTGKNPVAMKAGEHQEQTVYKNGETYKITASQNRFDIEKAGTAGKTSLLYNAQEKSWYVQGNGQAIKVAHEKDANSVEVIQPDGRTLLLNTATGQIVN